MIYLQQTQTPEMNPELRLFFLILVFALIVFIVLSRCFSYFEQGYALKFNKPFFLNFILKKKDLTKDEITLLKQEFSFYNYLKAKEQLVFRHRLSKFMTSKTFIVREDLTLTNEKKLLISATAVMLTFGFRNYYLKGFDKIIIYPKTYYSKINNAYHKGETNPQLKAIVFSWEDFKEGYRVGDDNLNLGIHEFGHAIHLNAFHSNDISSLIFKEGFNKLISYLQKHEEVKAKLVVSKYFRAYAYANHYEFFAVLLENFIETPDEFKLRFPNLYIQIKQMLNFNFAGY